MQAPNFHWWVQTDLIKWYTSWLNSPDPNHLRVLVGYLYQQLRQKLLMGVASWVFSVYINSADGFEVDCMSSSYGMTITLNKQDFFFLPEHLTLKDPSCTSTSNSTHVWLYTDYTKCSTNRSVSLNILCWHSSLFWCKDNSAFIICIELHVIYRVFSSQVHTNVNKYVIWNGT